VGCDVGHPIIYQYDIILIAGLALVAVLTGRPGDGASGQGDLPGGDALVLADQVHARVDERQVREDLGEVPKVPAGARVYLLGVQQQRAGVGRQLLAQRPGARLASPISVSAGTSHNERIVNVPSSPGPAHHHRSRPRPRRNSARPSKPSTAPADLRTSVAEVG